MRRGSTWAVAGAVAVLVVAAAVDALRGRTETTRASSTTRAVTEGLLPPGAADERASRRSNTERPPKLAERERAAARLARTGVTGALLLGSPGCRTWALRLPGLRWERAGESTATFCRIAVSGRLTMQPDGPLAVGEREDGLVVYTPSGAVAFRARGARAPAWKPDGTLTYVKDGEVRQSSRLRDRRLLVSRQQIAAEVGEGTLREIAWLDDDRFAAIIGSDRRDTIAVFRGTRLVARAPSYGGQVTGVDASPSGDLFAVRTGPLARSISFFDDRARELGVALGARAVAWSPDGRWAAVATGASVVVLDPRAAGTDIVRVRIAADDLAWRGGAPRPAPNPDHTP